MERCDGLCRGCVPAYSEKPREEIKYTSNGKEYCTEWQARNAEALLREYGIEVCTKEEVEGFKFSPNHPYFKRTVTILDLEFESDSDTEIKCNIKSREPSPKSKKRRTKQSSPSIIDDDFQQLQAFAEQNAKLATNTIKQNNPRERVIDFIQKRFGRFIQMYPYDLANKMKDQGVFDELYTDKIQVRIIEDIRKGNEESISGYIPKIVKKEKKRTRGLGNIDVPKLQNEYKGKFRKLLTEIRKKEWEESFDIQSLRGKINKEDGENINVDQEQIFQLFVDAQKRKFVYEHKFPTLRYLILHSEKLLTKLIGLLSLPKGQFQPDILLACFAECFGVSSWKIKETFNELDRQAADINKSTTRHEQAENVMMKLFKLLELYHFRICGLEPSEEMEALEAEFEKRKSERLAAGGSSKISYKRPRLNSASRSSSGQSAGFIISDSKFISENFGSFSEYEQGVVSAVYKRYLDKVGMDDSSTIEDIEICLVAKWKSIKESTDHAEKISELSTILDFTMEQMTKLGVCTQYNFLNHKDATFNEVMFKTAYEILHGCEENLDAGVIDLD